MLDVKGDAPGTLASPPLQGLPELVRPGLSDMKGLGAAANKSLLLSEYILPIGGFEGEVPNGLVF